MKTIPIARPVLALLLLCLPLRAEDEIEKAFRDALYAEEVKGDAESALKAYQAVSAKFEQQRDMAATALYRQAECQRKLGRAEEAVALYSRVLTFYGDKERVTKLCREALTGMGKAPAGNAGPPPMLDDESKEIARLTVISQNSPDLLDRANTGADAPLDVAAERGQARVVAWLLKALPNLTPARLREPLRRASGAGHLKVCELLIEAGADASASGALNQAVVKRHFAVARLMLTKGANPNGRGAGNVPVNRFIGTSLHIRQRKGIAERAGSGAEDGVPALIQAAGTNEVPPDVVAQLIAAGADVNATVTVSQSATGIDPWRGQYAVTPLGAAVAAGNLEKVKLLISAKAEINQPCGDLGATALMLSLAGKNGEIMRALTAAGADWKATLSTGASALQVAANFGFEEGVEAALQSGLSATAADRSGCTPLHAAAEAGSPAVARRLLKAGAVPNVISLIGGFRLTPLALVSGADLASNGHSELAKVLLEAGADPNLAGAQDAHPLRLAFGTGKGVARPEMVELLLSKGARPRDAGLLTELRKFWDKARSDAFDTRSRQAFLSVWNAAHRKDNPRLAHAVWLDEAEAALAAGGSPFFAALYSDDGAIPDPPSLRRFLGSAAWIFQHSVPRDWTRVKVTRLTDGSPRDLEVNVQAMAEREMKNGAAQPGGDFALQWGDIVAIPAGTDRDAAAPEKVRSWCVQDRTVQVRVELPGGELLTNGQAGSPPLVTVNAPASAGRSEIPKAAFLALAGIPANVLGFQVSHRQLGDSGTMNEGGSSAVSSGDILTFTPVTPVPEISGKVMSGGVWLCESMKGPFYPVPIQKYSGSNDLSGPPLGALLVALAAPNPLPFRHTDWGQALVRTVVPDAVANQPEPEWKEEKLLNAWQTARWRPGTVLVLPQKPENAGGLPPELEAELAKSLAGAWRLAVGQKPEVTVNYSPVFFRQETREGKKVWARTAGSPSVSPLLPRSLDMLYVLQAAGRVPAGEFRVLMQNGKGEGWLIEDGHEGWLPENAVMEVRPES